jgi:hypothetical protein
MSKHKKKRTGRKWGTANCPSCHAPWPFGCRDCKGSHTGYSGKLDSSECEYVVCGCTNDKLNVMKPTGEISLYWHLEDDLLNQF